MLARSSLRALPRSSLRALPRSSLRALPRSSLRPLRGSAIHSSAASPLKLEVTGLQIRSPAHRSARCATPRFTPPLLRQWILGLQIIKLLIHDALLFLLFTHLALNIERRSSGGVNRRAAQRAERWNGGAHGAIHGGAGGAHGAIHGGAGEAFTHP